MNLRISKAAFSRTLRLGSLAILCVLAGSPSAPAEDNAFPGFFSHIFGGPPAQDAAPSPPPYSAPRKAKKKVRDFVPVTATRAPGAVGGAPAQASFYIDVLGDSLGVSTSDGLTDAFADKPEVAVIDKARDASGLVNDGYYDWVKAAKDIAVDKGKADFVVVMVGINDIQALRDGNEALDPLSDRWRDIYGQRVDAVVAPFVTAHIPVAWVGLPPMRADKFNAQAIKLNEIYKEHAEKAGAKYIDIWDAFADQNGQYDAFGPNIEGQNVKLRGGDGILLTKAGSRKVAHFLEAEIHKALDKNKPATEVASLPPDIEQAADDINAQIRREMGAPPSISAVGPTGATAPVAPARPLAGPIVSLTARPMSPGGTLIARGPTPLAEPAEITRVIRLGEPVDTRAGRADDFSWPRL